MQIKYYADTDTLRIDFRDQPAPNGEDLDDDVVGLFTDEGELVSLIIEHATQRVDLASFMMQHFPAVEAREVSLEDLQPPSSQPTQGRDQETEQQEIPS